MMLIITAYLVNFRCVHLYHVWHHNNCGSVTPSPLSLYATPATSSKSTTTNRILKQVCLLRTCVGVWYLLHSNISTQTHSYNLMGEFSTQCLLYSSHNFTYCQTHSHTLCISVYESWQQNVHSNHIELWEPVIHCVLDSVLDDGYIINDDIDH